MTPSSLRLAPLFIRLLMTTLLLAAAPWSSAAKPSEAEAVHDVLREWIDACGGKSALKRQRVIAYRVRALFAGASQPVEFRSTQWAGGRYRITATFPNQETLTEAWDGRIAWRSNAVLGFGLVPQAEFLPTASDADPQMPLNAAESYPIIRLLPDDVIDGREVKVLGLTNRSGQHEKWYFSTITHLRVRLERQTPAGIVRNDYTDYRKVDGVVEPYHTVATGPDGRVSGFDVLTRQPVAKPDPSELSPTAAQLHDHDEAERILDKYVDACGGTAAILKLRSTVIKATVEITTAGLKFPATIYEKAPNLVLNRQEAPSLGVSFQGFDGKVGWAWSEIQGYRELKGLELAQMMNGADLHGPLHLRDKFNLRRLLGERTVAGRRAVGLALANLQGGAGSHYFDIETGQLLEVESVVNAGPQGMLKVVVDFSDFRTVGGLTMPFVTLITNPAVRLVTTIQSVEQNVELDDAIFKPRKDG